MLVVEPLLVEDKDGQLAAKTIFAELGRRWAALGLERSTARPGNRAGRFVRHASPWAERVQTANGMAL